MTRARDVANIDGLLTTTGDTFYASAAGTPARLGIGSSAQVLTVASGVPSWATPAVAASGLTLIDRRDYTSSATINVDNYFTSTYSSYIVVMEAIGSGSGSTDNMRIKLRYGGASGTTATEATYYGNALTTQHYDTSIVNTASSGLTYWTTALSIGGQGTQDAGRTWYNFQGVGNVTAAMTFHGNHYTTANTRNTQSHGSNTTYRNYTGFQVSTSGGNTMLATIAIYGLGEV